MVDLVREALRAHSIKLQYVNRPWQRAINEAKAGLIDGIIGAGTSDSKGLLLHSVPYASAVQGIAVRSEDDFYWDSAMSIGHRRLVKVLGYGYGGVLDEFIDKHHASPQIIDNAGDNVLVRNLAMIVKKRADITIDEINVLKMTAAKAGLHPQLRFLKTGRINNLYIALSPKIERSSQVATWLDEEMSRMIQDGRYLKIISEYGMDPWL